MGERSWVNGFATVAGLKIAGGEEEEEGCEKEIGGCVDIPVVEFVLIIIPWEFHTSGICEVTGGGEGVEEDSGRECGSGVSGLGALLEGLVWGSEIERVAEE
jgi:hypothetical protein